MQSHDTASSGGPQDSPTVAKLVEEAIGAELWARLIEPRRWDPTDDVEARIYGLLYRSVYGWTALPAAQPVWRDDEVICSCRKGEWCETPGKHPFGAWIEDTLPTAPSSGETIRRFRNDPRNIAILCGHRSGGLVVGDVDPRHGGTLEALWDFGWPQETPIERTGGGGFHVYAHTAENLPTVTYTPGLEVKGEGALVIASPSLHESHRRYGWLPDHSPWEVALAPIPTEVVEALKRPARQEEHGSGAPTLSAEEIGSYAGKLVARYVARAKSGVDGGRHNTMKKLSYQLWSLVHDQLALSRTGSGSERWGSWGQP
jgi:Bifunctional DNA primase/polymerase, N-terminal